jgi:hypothetical protein
MILKTKHLSRNASSYKKISEKIKIVLISVLTNNLEINRQEKAEDRVFNVVTC